MKKIIVSSIVGLALVAAISPAMARVNFHTPSMPNNHNNCCANNDPCCPEVKIDSYNNAMIKNSVLAVSNTGLNGVIDPEDNDSYHNNNNHNSFNWPNSSDDPGSITTKDATAVNGVENDVNSIHEIAMPTSGTLDIKTVNSAYVDNKVGAVANSGANLIIKSGTISTGGAGAQNSVVNMVQSGITVY
ncbi:MAG: hypothetical protein WC831_03020 [Parcubacteria group bacterium]|jgi:hypothetical protein